MAYPSAWAILGAMRGTETLATLIQLKEAEIQRLLNALSESAAELAGHRTRHEALGIERDSLGIEIRQARLNCTSHLEGHRVTAQAQQLQFREIARLNALLTCAVEKQSIVLQRVEQAQGKVDALRLELTEQLGQKASYRTIVERAERQEVLRQERTQDDALLEQWASRPRSH